MFSVVSILCIGLWWLGASNDTQNERYEYSRPNNLVASLCGADSMTLNSRLRADFLLRLQENRHGDPQQEFPHLYEKPDLESLLHSLPTYGHANGYTCMLVVPEEGLDTFIVFPEYYPHIYFRTVSGGVESTWPVTDNTQNFHVLYQQSRQRYWMFIAMGWGYPGKMYGPFAEPAEYSQVIANQMDDIRRQTIADAGGIP